MCENQSWKKEYIEAVFPIDNEKRMNYSENYFKEAVYRMMEEKLYKYRIVDDRSKKNLENDTLWLSCSHLLNDPFECAITIGNNSKALENIIMQNPQIFNVNKDLNPYKLLLGNNLEKQLRKDYEVFRKKVAICALSETFRSIRMWSYYANSHEGFCVEYDAKQLLKDLGSIYPVIYENHIWDVTITKETKNKINYFIRPLLIKAEEWEHEKEWRIIRTDVNGKGIPIRTPKPSAVYLGCKMSNDDKNDIIQICKGKDINVNQMVPSTYEYSLGYKEVYKAK